MYEIHDDDPALIDDIAALGRDVTTGEYTLGGDDYREHVDTIVAAVEDQYDEGFSYVIRQALDPDEGIINEQNRETMFRLAVGHTQIYDDIREEVNN